MLVVYSVLRGRWQHQAVNPRPLLLGRAAAGASEAPTLESSSKGLCFLAFFG